MEVVVYEVTTMYKLDIERDDEHEAKLTGIKFVKDNLAPKQYVPDCKFIAFTKSELNEKLD